MVWETVPRGAMGVGVGVGVEASVCGSAAGVPAVLTGVGAGAEVAAETGAEAEDAWEGPGPGRRPAFGLKAKPPDFFNKELILTDFASILRI